MGLAVDCGGNLLIFEQLVLTSGVIVNKLLILVLEPLFFPLFSLFEQNILFAVGVHILEQVNSGLVLSPPLLLACIPLLCIFLGNKVINHLFVSCLVNASLVVVLLKLDHLSLSRLLLFFFETFKRSFSSKSLFKHSLVTLLLGKVCQLSDLLLLSIVLDQLKVALTVQQELLVLSLLVFRVFSGPLFSEHFTLTLYGLDLCTSLVVAGLLLPLKNCHSVTDLLFLFSLFLDLTFELLLAIECPQLRVDLLLKHALLVQSTLVNQLFLTLNRSSVVVELSVFFPKIVIGSLKLHIKSLLDLRLAFLLARALQLLKTLPHLLADLLRSLEVVIEFLFVHTVFSLKKRS